MTTSIPHNVAREGTSDEYTPRKEDKFTFGLWTVGNRGRDVTPLAISCALICLLCGAYRSFQS